MGCYVVCMEWHLSHPHRLILKKKKERKKIKSLMIWCDLCSELLAYWRATFTESNIMFSFQACASEW